MTSNCCSQCCLAHFCCCCLELDGKQKYANVSYSPIKDESLQLKSDIDDNWMSPSSIVDSMDKLFSFPQQQSDTPAYPQMFSDMELSNPITKQPTARRFSVQSLTGADYDECVTGLSAEMRKKLQRSASIADSPQRKLLRSSMRSLSLPATNSPSKRQISTSAKSNIQSTSLPQDQQDILSRGKSESSWVLGLPIMEENDITGQDDKPTIQFSLYYDIQLSMLTVHLHRASNLPAKDRQGTSDPFVVVYLSPNKEESFQSKVMYRTLNPVFDQSFQFQRLTPDEIRRQTLIFRIYDHDRFTHNDSIGMVTLPLECADLYGVVMRMIIQDIEEEKQQIGKMLIALSYDPQLAMLNGIVLKVAELRKQDLIGLADPYIKINLMYKGKRKKKWKSTVKRNTLAPVFNEPFQFEISKEMNMSDIHMEVLLMDYDRFSRNDVIGIILIGENIGHTTGRKHWIDMLQSPRQSVSHWHSVMPFKL